MLRAAICEVIPVNRRDDHMVEPEFGNGFRHILRFVLIKRLGDAGTDIAERARAGAGVAHNHHGGVLLRPALTDVRTSGLLTNGDEIIVADDLAGLVEHWRTRRANAYPVRLAQNRAFRPVDLFRVPRPRFGDRVENGGPLFYSFLFFIAR